MLAVILAGGKGTRLKPLTNAFPKPLVPIGDMPILEVVIRQLKYYGVKKIIITVSHLAHLMQSFFGDGSKFGVEIEYSMEDQVLGTAGPLSLLDNLDENFIVMNGDLLTTINFSDFYNFHLMKNNYITIGTFSKEVKIDLGVLEIKDDFLDNYIEKPIYKFNVSMGIYAVKNKIIDFIPKNRKYDMPELVLSVKDKGLPVGCYSGDYEWLDIGRIDDYETAVELFEKNKNRYLPS